jgi:transposase InsO family protein
MSVPAFLRISPPVPACVARSARRGHIVRAVPDRAIAMTAQLVTDALMAIWRRGKPDALLHHSGRGSQ